VTQFHYDRAGHLIAESDNVGNVLREHLWLDDTPVGYVTAGALYFVHPDHLGTPQRITDGGQNVVWDMALAPFGTVAQLTAGVTENLRFPGQYADAETGLSYNFFRDYDPSVGRYVGRRGEHVRLCRRESGQQDGPNRARSWRPTLHRRRLLQWRHVGYDRDVLYRWSERLPQLCCEDPWPTRNVRFTAKQDPVAVLDRKVKC
jgi:hypothetical protein